jgi:predicted RND superfamily exporter protein
MEADRRSVQDAVSSWMVDHRALVMGLVLALAALAALYASRVRLEVQLEKMFPTNHPFVQLNRDLGAKFGGANTLLIAVKVRQGDVFDHRILEKIQRITDALYFLPENIRPLTASITLMKSKYIRSTGAGNVAIDGLLWPKLPETAAEIRFAKENVFANPMYEGSLVSSDGKAALIVGELKSDVDYLKVFEFLQGLRAKEQDENTEIYVTGRPMLYGWIFHHERQVFQVFALSMAVVVAILWLFFRNSHGVIAPLVVGLLTTVLGLGFVGAMGWSLSPLLLVLPFLQVTRAISHSVQIAVRYLEEQAIYKDNIVACKKHIEAMMVPNFGGCSTDAAGFAVLALAPIVLMQETATSMVAWMVGIYLASGWWHPLFLSLLPNPYVESRTGRKPRESTLGKTPTDRVNAAIARWAITPAGKATVLAIVLVLIVVSLYFSSKIVIGDPTPGSPILYPDSEYNRDSALINRTFDRAGSDTYVVFYEGKEDTVSEPAVLLTLDRLGRYLQERMPETFAGSWSIAPFATQLNVEFHDGDPRWAFLPPERSLLGLLIQMAAMKMESQDFARFADPKFSSTNAVYFFKDHTSATVSAAVQHTRDFFARSGTTIPGMGEFKIASGAIGVEYAVNSVITGTHTRIDISVLLAVFGLCVVSFRSIVAGLILVTPLVLANALAMGFMGLWGIGLSINTLPVAAVGIGLGVEFGIYLVSRYREEFARHGDLDRAIVVGAQTAAKAVIFTGLTMIAPVLLWYWVSSLKFQGEMGLLLAILLGANMVAAVTLLPVIVHLVKPRFITNLDVEEAAAPSQVAAKSLRGVALVAITLVFLLPGIALADIAAKWAGGDVHIAGSLSENIGFGLHRDGETDVEPGVHQQGDIRGLHEAYTWLDIESEWTVGERWKLRLNPWVIGDLAYVINEGTKDWHVFAPSDRKLAVDDEPLRIFREAYLQYTSDLFQVRAGQQTVGWGESDGLRLADVVNPLDITRQSFILDEGFRLTRIPQTMLRVIVTPGALMVGDRVIFNSWSVEGIVTPQIEPVRAYLSPDGRYGGRGAASGGGIWAAPPVDWRDRTEVLNAPPPLGPLDGFIPDNQIHARDRQPHYEWTDPLLAARITGEFSRGRVTLNYAQRVGTILDFPVVVIRNITVTGLPTPRPGFQHLVTEASLDIDLTYPRKHILGATFNYDLGEWIVAPGALGGTSPVVRVEATYTLGHPFNSAQRVKSDIGLADLLNFPNVTAAAYPKFLQRDDFLQYMVGMDWPLRVDLINPTAEVFNSFQVFHFKPIGAGEELAIQPYKRLTVHDDWVFLTFLAFTPYWNRRIVPQVLVGFDVNNVSWFTKSKISHELGDHWRIEYGVLYFNRGRVASTSSVFGLYDRRSDLYARIAYQF